jgi:Flp pilus assembly protein TadG
MGSSQRRTPRRDEGQALTELSLTVGFLCLMLLAVWQIGTVFSNYIDLSEAAREGARAAALTGAPTTAGDTVSLTAAQNNGNYAASNSASVAGMTVSIAPVGSWIAGGKVRATVSAPYSLSLFGVVTVASGTMSVQDDMRIHRQGS